MAMASSEGMIYVTGGGIDDTAEIQAAINTGPTTIIGNCVSGPLNATNRVLRLSGLGPTLSNLSPLTGHSAWATPHGHLIDLTGSYLSELKDFSIGWIDGSTASPIIIADAIFNAQSNPATSNINSFRNLFIKGNFRSTAFYIYGVASGTVDNCQFSNFLPGASTAASALYMTGKNGWGLQSQFATLLPVPTGGAGTPQWAFQGAYEIHMFPGVAGANSAAIMLDGASDVHFGPGNISAGGRAYVEVTGNCGGISFEGTSFGPEANGGSVPASIFYVNSGANLSRVSMDASNDYSGLTTIYAGPGTHP